MSLIPWPYNWLAAGLAILALVGSAWFAKHSYDERRRDEGRAEIRQLWHEAVVAQQAKEEKAAAAAQDFATRLEVKRGKDFDALARRNKALEDRLAAVPVGPDLVVSLRDAVRTSNGEEGPRAPEENAAASTGLAVSTWFSEVARLYRSCREQVAGWIAWDDDRVAQ